MDLSFEPAPRRAPAFWQHWGGQIVTFPLLLSVLVAAGVGARLMMSERATRPAVAVPAAVVCWDGVERPRAKCGIPQGVAGLRYVFPSFQPFSGRCERTRFRDRGQPRPVEFVCGERVRNYPVTVTYTRRTTVVRGLSYVASLYPDIKPTRSAGGELVTYRSPDDRGYSLTRLYQRFPFSVSVHAPTKKLREVAVTELVRTRPAGRIAVRAVL